VAEVGLHRERQQVPDLDEGEDHLALKFVFVLIGVHIYLECSKVEEGEHDPDSYHDVELLLQVQLVLHVSNCPHEDHEAYSLHPAQQDEDADVYYLDIALICCEAIVVETLLGLVDWYYHVEIL
jgi:hypothetical protein